MVRPTPDDEERSSEQHRDVEPSQTDGPVSGKALIELLRPHVAEPGEPAELRCAEADDGGGGSTDPST